MYLVSHYYRWSCGAGLWTWMAMVGTRLCRPGQGTQPRTSGPAPPPAAAAAGGTSSTSAVAGTSLASWYHPVIIMTLSCHCDGAAARTPAGELIEQRLVQRLEAREGLQRRAGCIVSVVVWLSSPDTAEIERGETRPIIYSRLHLTNIVHQVHVIVLFVKCKVP